MINQLKSYIRNLSLKNKIFSITLFHIILIASVAFISLEITARSSEKLLYRTIAGSLSYSATDITRRLTNIQTMSYMILSNTTTQNNLSTIKDSSDYIKRTQAYQELNFLIPNYYETFKENHLNYINLYNDTFITYTNKPRSNQTPADIQRDVIALAKEAEGAPCWVTKYGNEYGLFLGREIRRAELSRLDSLGTLLIHINLEEMIASATKFFGQYEYPAYFIMNQQEPVYHSPGFRETDAMTIQTSLDSPYGVVSINGRNYFAVRGVIPDFDWDYICMVSYDSITHALRLSQLLCAVILFSCIFISILVSRRLIHSLVYHFDTLLTKMVRFGKEEAHIPEVGYDYQNRNDEIGVLHRSFDSMAGKIHHLIQVNYVNELLKKEAQLKALENQINPHFLYNTLESVNWRAKAIGETEISSMVEALGALLRATLSNKDGSFTFGQELDLVTSYITIQKIRFDDRLKYEITVSKELYSVQIPKLTVQPLVENAIHYALEEMSEECLIQIIAQRLGSVLNIYVKNKGSYFEDGLIEKLIVGEIQPRGFGIGLLNIDKRLKLTFGDSYGLTLRNDYEDEMAVAIITVPFEI